MCTFGNHLLWVALRNKLVRTNVHKDDTHVTPVVEQEVCAEKAGK